MSLDPESLLGFKVSTIKAVAAGTLSGVLFRRNFSLGEVLSAGAAGFGSGLYLAPAVNALLRNTEATIETGLYFLFGAAGIYIYGALTTYAPSILRALARRFLGIEPPPSTGDKPGGGA